MARFFDPPSRFSVQPIPEEEDPSCELWGIYDFVKCDWAGDVYGEKYLSKDFDLLSEVSYLRNKIEDMAVERRI